MCSAASQKQNPAAKIRCRLTLPLKSNSRGAFTAIAMVILALLGSTAAWSKDDTNPYDAAIPESYPIPVPVTPSDTRLLTR